MNKINIVILGSGGHTRSIINLINKDIYEILGVFDDSYNLNSKDNFSGIQLKGSLKDIPNNSKIILSVGDNMKREEFFKKYKKNIFHPNSQHTFSFIEKNTIIGKSNQFFANSYINSLVKIGDNNILNSGCIIEHESKLGNHNHISVGAIICGRVNIGDNCFIGAGSVIKDKISICNNVVIGANSLVINDIVLSGVYVGSPVKKIS